MGRKKQPPLPAPVEKLRRQLEAWRKRKKSTREPIPDAIWRSATALAQTHGVNRIAVALRLNYDALKARAEGAGKKTPRQEASPPVFVELDVDHSVEVTGCVIELEDRSGRKLVIRLKSSSDLDLAALTSSFWRRRR